VGRITLPPLLKKAAGIDQEVVIAGVLNKIEVWPKEVYMQTLSNFFEGEEPTLNFGKLAEEAMEQTETNEINLPMIGKVNVL
jgi:DNA-binding transcriptional regulator/RsmH inhibitor MraZ